MAKRSRKSHEVCLSLQTVLGRRYSGMSIDQTACRVLMTPSITLLICIGLIGVTLGLGLALAVMRVCRLIESREQRKRLLEEEADRVRRKQEQEAALVRREREQEVIDLAMDERMMCFVCWQERHLGMNCPFPRLCLCSDHYNQPLLEEAAMTEIIRHPSINQQASVAMAMVLEEVSL